MKQDPVKILRLSIGALVIIFFIVSGFMPEIIPRDIGLLVGMGVIIGYFIVEALFLLPQIEQTREGLTKLTFSLGTIEIMEGSNRYYTSLEEAMRNASSSLRLVYLTTEPPSKLEARAEVYWNFFTNFAKNNQRLLIKRIASIVAEALV